MFYFGPDGENGRKQYDDFEYAGEKRIVEIDRVIGPRVAQRVHIYGNGLYLRHDVAFVFTTGEQCLLYRCCGCKCCRRLEAAEFQGAGYEIRAVGIIRDFWPAVGVKVGFERRRYDYESENFAFLHCLSRFGETGIFRCYGERAHGRKLAGEITGGRRVVEVDYCGGQFFGQTVVHQREEECVTQQWRDNDRE